MIESFERKAKEEAEREAKEEAERKVKEEVEREAKEEAERQARVAAATAAQKQIQNAPPVADSQLIEQAMKNHPASSCTNRYGWVKKDCQCRVGGHKLTWEQLGMH
jgi:hypothetical protein